MKTMLSSCYSSFLFSSLSASKARGYVETWEADCTVGDFVISPIEVTAWVNRDPINYLLPAIPSRNAITLWPNTR
jgi:hypothetical protein